MKRTLVNLILLGSLGLAVGPRIHAQEKPPAEKKAPPSVTFILRDGKSVKGRLVGYADGVFRVKVGDGEREIAETEILMVYFHPGGEKKPAGPDRLVHLHIDKEGRLFLVPLSALEAWDEKGVSQKGVKEGNWKGVAEVVGTACKEAKALKPAVR
ncbi:MAG: hypothetical protein ACYTHN_17640, partial [Planctomycetota bacterium]